MKKAVACIVMVLMVMFLVSIFLDETTSKAFAQKPKRGGTFTFALHYEPPHWDPHLTLSYRTQVYNSFVYSKLNRDRLGEGVDVNEFTAVPDLATKWQYLNPTELVYTLRKGVKFHNRPPVNGREITSADVKYTFDRIFDPKLNSPNKAYYEKIDRIEIPDSYTVKFHLKEPFAPFVKYTALTYGFLVAKEVVEQFGDLKKWESAIGSGPIILKEYIPNEIAHYVRHPEYYEKDKPYLDEVKLRIMPSPQTIVAAFRTKQLDYCQWMEYEELQDMLKKHPDMKYNISASNSFYRLTFATDKPPFNDKRVRQAVSLCFDRKRQLEILYDGRGEVDHVLTLAMWGSLPLDKLGKASKYFQRDVEEAKRLVKTAGYKTPLNISMAFAPAYGTVVVSATEALVGQLDSSGVFSVKLVPQEYGAYVSSTYRGKYDEDCWYGPTTPPVEPDEILWDLYYSTSSRNSCRVKDPHLDKLLEAQRQELNEEKRLAKLKEIQYYLAEQMYIMPTTARPIIDTWWPYVRGYMRHNVPAYNIGDLDRLIWIDK